MDTDNGRTLQDLIRMRESWVQTRNEADDVIRSLDRTISLFRQSDDEGTDKSSQRTRSYSRQICDAIENILNQRRPLHRKQILKELIDSGFVIGGMEPLTTLASYLSRDARFKNSDRGFWTLSLNPQMENMEVDDEIKPQPTPRLYTREMDFDGASNGQ